MNKETYWIKWLGIAFCTVVVSAASCTAHENYLASEVIKVGADPMALSCGTANKGDKAICAIWAMRGAK